MFTRMKKFVCHMFTVDFFFVCLVFFVVVFVFSILGRLGQSVIISCIYTSYNLYKKLLNNITY